MENRYHPDFSKECIAADVLIAALNSNSFEFDGNAGQRAEEIGKAYSIIYSALFPAPSPEPDSSSE